MSLFMTEALNRIHNSPFISVSVISGPALGGGAELCTCTDFRVMSESAYVCFVHAKLGASPGWGAVPRLTAAIGRTGALELLGTSKKLNFEEALQSKFVSRIVKPHQECVKTGLDFLSPFINQNYIESVKSVKVAVAAASNEPFELANKVATDQFSKRWAAPDNLTALKSNSR